MIRALWTAGSGMNAQQMNIDVIANNLANVSTTGYKRDDLVAEAFREKLLQAKRANRQWNVGPIGSGVAGSWLRTDFSPGAVVVTHAPLDLALAGEGFLVVQTPAGQRLTRNGSLVRDAEGYLATRQGYRVLGDNGPIYLAGTDVRINGDGEVTVDGAPAGRLLLMKPAADGGLIKEGANLFRSESGLVPADCRVQQGVLENANVQAVMEMVRMIDVSRAYEANQKVLAAHDSALDKAVNEVGRV